MAWVLLALGLRMGQRGRRCACEPFALGVGCRRCRIHRFLRWNRRRILRNRLVQLELVRILDEELGQRLRILGEEQGQRLRSCWTGSSVEFRNWFVVGLRSWRLGPCIEDELEPELGHRSWIVEVRSWMLVACIGVELELGLEHRS
jgi:hypothetical protein